MVGESCGESLRLNYTDREHQIQEKKTSQALGRMMGWEQRGRDMEVVYARDVEHLTALHPLPDMLGCPQTPSMEKKKGAVQVK